MRWISTAFPFVAVIAVVAILGTLLVGAIQHARHAADRTQCTNNLKLLGLTLQSYHDANRHLPCAIARAPTREFPPEMQLGWMEGIIPYLDAHMDPKWITDRKLPWDHPENQYVARKRLAVFRCPANPHVGEDYQFSSYVGISGVGADAAWLPLDDPNAGAFGYERTAKFSDMKNGNANVVMVSETATDNGPWVRGGQATARGLDRNGDFYLGEHGQLSSHHVTTQVVMAGATVRTFTDDTADHVLESLATLAGR